MTVRWRAELEVFLVEAFGTPELVAPAPGKPCLIKAFGALLGTLAGKASLKSCLRAWSVFIRERDGKRCVMCHAKRRLTAHHICRKSFLPFARLDTGNGITLCRPCHKDVHKGFNGKPDLTVPMDAQGGEKIETMLALYGALLHDARDRELLTDQYYFLSDAVLRTFKGFQGFPPATVFPGYRLEQAYAIWRAAPQRTLQAVLKAVLRPAAASHRPSRKPVHESPSRKPRRTSDASCKALR